MKSAVSLSWATSVFAAVQMTRMLGLDQGREARASFDRVSRAAGEEAAPMRNEAAREEIRLDVGTMVVIGEGLAAGVGDFALTEESQIWSFAAQAARHIGTPFLLPLLQSPGVYGAPGLPPQPVVLPHLLQTTVVGEFPLRRQYNNIAIPGYELDDCLRRRPVPPLVHRDDARQSIANCVLGLAALTTDPQAPRLTQLEYAVARRPTLAIVELGYAEALRLAFGHGELPSNALWADRYTHLVRELRECGAEVVVATVPDPADTGGCLALDDAARAVRVGVTDLQQRYGLSPDDCLTIAGLTRVAFHVLGGPGDRLESRDVVPAAHAARVRDRVERMNDAIVQAASQLGAHVFDLCDVTRSVRAQGVAAGNQILSADFLGGFYTLNGVYPGPAGHAVIANELLACLGAAFSSDFGFIDVGMVAAMDPVADYRAPGGGDRPIPPSMRRPATASGGAPREDGGERRAGRLRLPPTLEMTVPLSHAGSYHGDAIRIVDTGIEADARFGSTAGVLFGGPVLFDSHLSGSVHIRFSPPQGDTTRFEITFEPLAGEDGVLSAPMFFRWPVQQCRVVCEPNVVSGGTLHLETGEVTDLTVAVRYLNSALQALVSVNPGFPDQPIVFPGQYGSAWARFEQRDDDSLDFTFYGSTFLPLGGRFGDDIVRWALPFAGAPYEFASIPARGMALHPHLQLSTRDAGEDVEPGARRGPIQLPHNSVCELTLFTRRSSFGDKFTLNTPELGGPATGRSHLLGRLLVQTGEPFGGSMPVVVSLLTPGGLLGQQPPAPLATLFPGRLSPGPVGHDEHLRFPTRNYFLDAVTLIDDPFDFSVGAVDLGTGRFINQLLHRGFIGQDLFFSLIRVEPRTPRESFLFRGPAAIEQAGDGTLMFRLRSAVNIPYPVGFGFPAPDLTSAIVVGDNSLLDPYLWLRASSGHLRRDAVTLGRDRVRSSTGEEFSYRLEVRDEGTQPLAFDYVNHELRASFRLETVSWFGRAVVPTPAGESEMFTFSGFGRWSKDPTGRAHQVSAQIAVGAEEYVSVQIDSGLVSNVNTRPAEEAAALP